ncbi:hypothetical protein A2U01_0038429 [Trifolium medium]|uniref:Uncharacterized protein n=1 Tax=Trifolium medium TaxID=97028 RepID=A0A392Q049_9FABA|nr:hypothetical protein [Trifolium medium]
MLLETVLSPLAYDMVECAVIVANKVQQYEEASNHGDFACSVVASGCGMGEAVRLNTDGAAKGELGSAGCGGLLRGCSGEWLYGFSKNVGRCSECMDSRRFENGFGP